MERMGDGFEVKYRKRIINNGNILQRRGGREGGEGLQSTMSGGTQGMATGEWQKHMVQ
jgi:hypothetical protein